MPNNDNQNVVSIISESIQTGLEYLPRLINGLEQISDLLRQGQLKEINHLMPQALEGLQWFLTVISSIEKVPVLLENGVDYNKKLDDFQLVVKNLLDAFSIKDYVLSADIIEYELIEKIEDWLEQFKKINIQNVN